MFTEYSLCMLRWVWWRFIFYRILLCVHVNEFTLYVELFQMALGTFIFFLCGGYFFYFSGLFFCLVSTYECLILVDRDIFDIKICMKVLWIVKLPGSTNLLHRLWDKSQDCVLICFLLELLILLFLLVCCSIV